MRRPITPLAHGLIDYTTVATVAAAPRALGLSKRAATTCYALAGAYAALSMLTDYPLAVRRLVPFKAHGVSEGAIGAFLPLVPYALGFDSDTRGRNLLFGLAGLTAVVAALTDWNKRSERVARRRHRRKPRLRAA
jgi:hypothetical protein